MKNNIIVVFSSHLSDEENAKFSVHIHETIGCKHQVVCYPNFNQYSLPEIYNKAIAEYNTEDAIMVFCHNDIIIRTKNWGKLLLTKFNSADFQIIGVAGSTYLAENGVWWTDRSKMCGIVEHTDGISTWVSEYAPAKLGYTKPVVLVDGLFIAADCSELAHGWDEEFRGFHMYDVSFCIPNYLDGCNIGVTTDIKILHKSVGMTNAQWDANRAQFVEKYKDELPIKYATDGQLRVLICCQFFKNYTGSEVSNYELSRELVKLGCDVSIISSMVGDPLESKAKKNGVKVYSFGNLPNHVLDDKGQFHFTKNEQEFDIIHINHKPIGELILQLYPNTPAVMHVRSEVIPIFEVPIIDPAIKRYISIRETITDYIKTFGIEDEQIVTIDNPFDTKRFNTNYKHVKNPKEVVLFIGTLDYLRKQILFDLIKTTKENNQELWVIGADNDNYAKDLLGDHVKYLGVKSNVEEYIKKCDYTAGIFKGRTTIEGFLCGKQGWIYTVDISGNIVNKVLQPVPDDIQKYSSEFSAKKVLKLYNEVLDNL